MTNNSQYSLIAQRVLLEEAEALSLLAKKVEHDFDLLVDFIIYKCKGRIILTGMGKSGYIARKISASFSSTGTPSMFLHPAEASHGDLGMITQDDLVIMLSTSGYTKELTNIITYCKRFAIKIAAITMEPKSDLSYHSDFLLLLPKLPEASRIIAPSTSAVMMLAIGDALTIAVQEAKGFSKEDFAKYHPGGKIGANLIKVQELMHKGKDLPLVQENTSFADMIVTITQKSLGCAFVINNDHILLGVITDGDLRRHLEHDGLLAKKAKDFMTSNPKYIASNSLGVEALAIMNNCSITNLAVVENDKIVGAIHIHDLLKAGIA